MAAAVGNAEIWAPGLRVICQRHRLAGDRPLPLDGGTNPVFATPAGLVIKLYAPLWPDWFESERAVLSCAHGRLGVATPEIVAEGELDGWRYLVVTRLDGVELHEVWPELDRRNQLAIARSVGELIARLHALPAAGLERLSRPWPEFVAHRIERCVAQHRERGSPESWVRQLPEYLDRLPPLHPRDFTPVPLGGDIHQWHLMAAERHGRWELAGIFDFDDAMTGFREYEFARPAAFLTPGRPELLRSLLLAYGFREHALDEALAGRLFAYVLLHRYAVLRLVLKVADPGGTCATLADLQRHLCSFR